MLSYFKIDSTLTQPASSQGSPRWFRLSLTQPTEWRSAASNLFDNSTIHCGFSHLLPIHSFSPYRCTLLHPYPRYSSPLMWASCSVPILWPCVNGWMHLKFQLSPYCFLSSVSHFTYASWSMGFQAFSSSMVGKTGGDSSAARSISISSSWRFFTPRLIGLTSTPFTKYCPPSSRSPMSYIKADWL